MNTREEQARSQGVEPLSIREFARALRRHAFLFVACVTVVFVPVAYTAFSAPSSYTAHTEFFVSSTNAGSTDSQPQNSNLVMLRIPSYVALVNSSLVVDRVVSRL